MRVITEPAAAFILLGLIAAAPLQGDEFSFLNQNARAAGMGGAFVAKADNVFALYDNPAGLAFLDGLRVGVGYLVNNRTVRVSWPSAGRTISSDPFQFWGNAALSWQPWSWVTLGVGFFTPHSAEFSWPWTWPGRPLSVNMKLDAQCFRPAVAFRLPGNLAVGAGLDFVDSNLAWNHEMTLSFDKFPDLSTVLYDSRFEMSGHGLGFSAGALWKPHRVLQVGVKYQHRAAVDYRGFNVFDSRTPAAPLMPHPTKTNFYFYEFFNFFFKRQEVTSRLTWPREITAGVLVAPFPNLSLAFDAQWTAWHEMESWDFRAVNSDENLSPDFTPLFREFYGVGPDYGFQSAGLALKDSWTFKGGIEYSLFGRFGLRGGFARSMSAAETRTLNPVYPDLDRTILSLGFGYEGPFFSIWDRKEMGRISVDVFFQYARAKKTTSSLLPVELTYDGNRWVLGIGVGFIF